MNCKSAGCQCQKIEKPVYHIIKKLRKNGFSAYVAGGAVRDMVLKKRPNDFDIVTNASLDTIASLFSDQKIKKAGRTFPICIINGIEVSPSRAGSSSGKFCESDLSKRDFTINAMAFDPVKNRIVDPFNGKSDLHAKIIRFTGNPESRIQEDPVRMIRACRFAAMLGGYISPDSLEAILSCSDLVDNAVAKERIGHEIFKAMALDKPSLFFTALKKTGLLSKILPCLDRCCNLDGGPFHGESVFEHCLLVGDAISAKYPVLRLAGFLHDIGKFDAAVIKENKAGKPYVSFPGHEKHTEPIVRDLTKLRFSAKDIAYISSVVKSHMHPLKRDTTPKAVRRLLAMLDRRKISYADFMRMRIADNKGNLLKKPYALSSIRIRLLKLFAEINASSPLNERQLNITGYDVIEILKLKPGPEIGRIKQVLFEKIVDDPEMNNYKDLKKLCLTLKTG